MADEKRRKRAWGKTKNRGKGPPEVETMESDTDTSREPVKKIKLMSNEETNNKHAIDLQYPELMTDSTLVTMLSNIKVPIPVYPDGTPSRERLIYLFKKHVTPQPQRTGGRGRFWRKRSGVNRGSSTNGAALMDTNDHDWSDIAGSNVSTVTAISRKRSLDDSVSTSSKKPSLQIPYKSLSKISVNDTFSAPLHNMQQSKTPFRLLKLKGTDLHVDKIGEDAGPSQSSNSSPKISWP